LIEIEVHDQAILVEYARQLYRASFGDPAWVPGSVGEAALEALVLSATGPAPNEMGIEILETVARERE
jgi:hypothetical protein